MLRRRRRRIGIFVGRWRSKLTASDGGTGGFELDTASWKGNRRMLLPTSRRMLTGRRVRGRWPVDQAQERERGLEGHQVLAHYDFEGVVSWAVDTVLRSMSILSFSPDWTVSLSRKTRYNVFLIFKNRCKSTPLVVWKMFFTDVTDWPWLTCWVSRRDPHVNVSPLLSLFFHLSPKTSSTNSTEEGTSNQCYMPCRRWHGVILGFIDEGRDSIMSKSLGRKVIPSSTTLGSHQEKSYARYDLGDLEYLDGPA